MKTLHITISDKIATFARRDGDIVCGNSDYQIKFTFDDEWANYKQKTARFKWNGKAKDITFEDDVCPVPIINNAQLLTVGVYVEDLYTTTPAEIPCKRSILCASGEISDGSVVVPEGTPVLGDKTITRNGIYKARTDNYDGYFEVEVAVEGGGAAIPIAEEVSV